MPIPSKAPTAMAFGAEPIIVPIPPIAAAVGMPKTKTLEMLESFPN